VKFGAHCSTAGGIHKALERARFIGGETAQVFVKNNMQWFGRPHTPAELAQYANQLNLSGFACVFGHSGYLINLAAAASTNRDNSLKSLLQEIEMATALGLPFIVMHPGAHLEAGEERGLDQIVAGLNEVFRATTSSPVRIALENTAGQGSCLGYKMAHLVEIYERVERPERLAICLDTAHLFAAGYDIRTPKGWDAALAELKSVGLEQIVAFHLNDSKTELGSHVDRHAGIGAGKIGREAFRHIVNDSRFAKLPGCLETPKSKDLHEDVENLAILRALVEKTPEKRKRRVDKRRNV
jgi:deoxyribonuclease-4